MESREGRFLTKLNDRLKLVDLYLVNERIGEATYDDLLVRKEILDEVWQDFRKHEDAIRSNNDIEADRIKLENHYLELMGNLRYKLRAMKPDEENESLQFNDFLRNQSKFLNEFSMVNRQKQNEVKLPALNIPHFGGDYHDWPTFENLFLQIHTDVKINKIRKFQYLKGLMIPNSTPDQLIKHFSITEKCYDEAWELLCDRFNKRRHIITAFVKKFFELPSTTQASVSSLRNICDTTENIIRGLKAIGPEAESRDPFLIYMLIDKIDDETKHLWARESGENDNPSVNEFLKFLSRRCDALETVQSSIKQSSGKVSSQSATKSNSRQRICNMLSHNESSKCLKCNQQHMLHECTVFKSMNAHDRQKFVISQLLCFNCLRSGHRSINCRGNKSCHKCNKRHHTLLHLSPSTAFINQSSTGNAINAHPGLIDNNSHTVPSENTTQTDSHSRYENQPNSVINSMLSNNYRQSDDNVKISDHDVISSMSYASLCPVNMHQDSALLHVADVSHVNSLISSRDVEFNCNTLLPTANVYIMDSSRTLQRCRGLLDSGSHASFITESCAQRLSLQRFCAKKHVSGLASNNVACSRGYVELQVFSRSRNKIMTLQALVLHNITSRLPTQFFDISSWDYVNSLQLADDKFNIPSSIDLLIGIEYSLDIISDVIHHGSPDFPTARKSPFGWILSGKLPENTINSTTVHHSRLKINVEDSIDKQLRMFWELENVPQSVSVKTEDEKNCEISFKAGVKRLSSGRFSVRLPFKPNIHELGNSLNKAICRFNAMERLFKRNPEIKLEYSKFINEYISLQHMSEVPSEETFMNDNQCFYLPHHAVLKEDSSTTKLRVVFDGSSKSTSGYSINDNLLVGEQLQPTLFTILLKFRRHKIAMISDIEKMFRQIDVHDDNDYQRIIWRENENEPFRHYRLGTVTYGLACSPFLATRSLRELSTIIRDDEPLISKLIDEQFYVDDLMIGCDDSLDAIELRRKMSQVLLSAGFSLRKWKSNDPKLLASIPPDLIEGAPHTIQDSTASFKVLGMQWIPHSDKFTFIVKPPSNHFPTKRTILSDVASIFDPLGLLAPSVILMKILLQSLWLRKLDWDDQLPDDIKKSWLEIRSQFESFNTIHISRNILQSFSSNHEIHGFADASERAYAAAVYIRSIGSDGSISVHLVAAKTKVTPLKTISIPRLELCAALLLVKLVKVVKESLDLTNYQVICWSDSTTVLAWLSDHPSRWKTFVANRTAEILEDVDRNCWHHVSSSENAADCASRGLMPNDLKNFDMWWHGPAFLRTLNLKQPPYDLTSISTAEAVKHEEKIKSSTALISTSTSSHQYEDIVSILIKHCSSWFKLIRSMAFVLRFINNCKIQSSYRRQLRNHQSSIREYSPYSNIPSLITSEIKTAQNQIFKLLQKSSFEKDLHQISRNGHVSPQSTMISLSPFIHTDGLIRVGGRLHYSNVPFDMKHQIILPNQHPITILLIQHYHLNYFHVGTTMLISLLRQRYWILNCRNVVKKFVHQCTKCFRQKATTLTQFMGSLPQARTLENLSAFTHTGVDYAGPILIKSDKQRKATYYKGYIVLFVCLSTKAIHIEVAKDLSTEKFLQALTRFYCRRGLPSKIYSDNGTNFVGADRELKQMFSFLKSSDHNAAVINELARYEIEWKFIPPNSPHFGGLWEAGVKSVKYHLKTTLNSALTFDEFTTILSQIEAILNSRPLCPMSDDPTDLNFLTPGHFLINKPITLLPFPDVLHISENRLSHWQSLQRRVQGYWKLWRMDYLSGLQQRPKWRIPTENIQEGALVIIKEDNLPPGLWKLARVIKCYPGKDNKVRVVDIKTKDGILRRPIHKLCLLPNQSQLFEQVQGGRNVGES